MARTCGRRPQRSEDRPTARLCTRHGAECAELIRTSGDHIRLCRYKVADREPNGVGEFVRDDLAEYARRHNPRVSIVPTSIELEKYPVQPELPADDPFVVVWSGSTHTLVHFEHARAALETLAARRRILVKVICNRPPDRPIAGAQNVFVPWAEQDEAANIGAAHVGIMPLPDETFTRGKCGLKALQYMATGRPTIASPVGMNVDLIRHGENGYLAGTTGEMLEALERLAQSAELRRSIGLAGRCTVEERYSAEIVADKFADAVRLAVGDLVPAKADVIA